MQAYWQMDRFLANWSVLLVHQALEGRRLHKAIICDIMALNKKHEKGQQKNMLFYDGKSKGTFNLVAIPRPVGVEKIWRTARDSKCVDNLVSALGGGAEDTLLNFLSSLARTEAYKEIWDEAVHMNGYTLSKIVEITTNAIQYMCNINRSQMKTLRSCLRMELGATIFSTEHKISQVVNLEHVEPVTGMYKYGSEHIPWSYKSVFQCLKLWMETRLHKDKDIVKTNSQIDICINLDHGKVHSRITGTSFRGTRMMREIGTKTLKHLPLGTPVAKRTTQK
jgi:hypothetical protein